jgi:hypothetical protein
MVTDGNEMRNTMHARLKLELMASGGRPAKTPDNNAMNRSGFAFVVRQVAGTFYSGFNTLHRSDFR